MLEGVTIVDPAATYIEPGVRVGRDTVIHPGVQIGGATEVGSGCTIESNAVIRGCRLGNGIHVKTGSVMTDALLHDGVAVGPMAHLRPAIWWGGLLLVLGAFYCYHFAPGRSK